MRALLRMKSSVLSALLLGAGLLLVSGCGGGGTLPPPVPEAPAPTGRVAFGPLDGAEVEIYRVVGDGTFVLLATQTSSGGGQVPEVGMFDPTPVQMAADELYLYKAEGGAIVDLDDDGVVDGTPTAMQGTLHALATGAQALSGDVKLNSLTEILYQRVVYMLAARYPAARIVSALDEQARLLLHADVDGNGAIDLVDTLRWDAADAPHLAALRKDWDHYDSVREALTIGSDGWLEWEMRSLTDCSVAIRFFDESVQDVHVAGDRAYLAIEDEGFAIVDVSDPLDPTVLNYTNGLGEGEDIGVQGDFLYYAHRDGGPMRIFDVSTPAAPVARGNVPMTEPDCLLPDGNLLFAADRTTRQIHIIDITDPDAPFEITSIDTMDDPNDIVRAGDYIYVADSDYLTVIDVSTPAAPFVRASIEAVSGDVDGLQVAGDYAYCADGHAGLLVVDVSDLDDLQIVANLPSRGECDRIWIEGNRLYMSANETGVQVVDITTPTAPTLVGYIVATPRAAVTVTAGGYAYVACHGGGLRVFDLSEPVAALYADLADEFVLGTVATGTGNADVVASGDYAYLAKDDGLSIVDLGDPVNPTLVWSDDFVTGDSAAVAMMGDMLYVAAEDAGLQIVDVTDPLSPDVKAPFALSDRAQDVAVVGNLACVADRYGDGFLVVDVTNPDVPVRLGDCAAVGGNASGVAVQGDHAYCAWDEEGLQAIDMTTPTAPTIVDSLVLHDVGSTSPSNANRVAVQGDYAYVVADELHVVNISDPNDLTLETTFEIDVDDTDVALVGAFAFVVGSTEGILALDASNPADPALLARLPLLGDARAVFVHGDLLLIALEDSGLAIMRAPFTANIP